MTFRLNFYAEQAFLSHVEKILKNHEDEAKNEKYDNHHEFATCIILLYSSLESVINKAWVLCDENKFITEIERKGIEDKFIELVEYQSLSKLDFGKKPYQSLKILKKMRDILCHFKNENFGLYNSEWKRVPDSLTPKKNEAAIHSIDWLKMLMLDSIKELYDDTLLIINDIVDKADLSDSNEFEFIKTGNYVPMLFG